MCMQILSNYSLWFKSYGQFSLVHYLDFGKASTKGKYGIWQSPGLDLININMYAKFHLNIPYGSRERTNFTFSEFGPRQSLDQWQMAFGNPSIKSCQSQCVCIFYPNIPCGLRVMGYFHFYSEFGLRQSLGQRQMIFIIPWARSCHYQCVCEISSKYSIRFKR